MHALITDIDYMYIHWQSCGEDVWCKPWQEMLSCDRERLKITLTSLAQYKRNVMHVQAQFKHNLSFVYVLSLFQQNRTLKGPRC